MLTASSSLAKHSDSSHCTTHTMVRSLILALMTIRTAFPAYSAAAPAAEISRYSEGSASCSLLFVDPLRAAAIGVFVRALPYTFLVLSSESLPSARLRTRLELVVGHVPCCLQPAPAVALVVH